MLSAHNWRTHLSRYATAQVAVFLFFVPYLANLHQEWTRYAYFWRTADTFSLAALIVVLGVACWGVGEAAIRTRAQAVQAVARACWILIVFAGLGGVLNFAASKLWGAQLPPTGAVMAIVGGLAVAVVLADNLRPTWRLLHAWRRLSQVALPIFPVTIVSLLLRSTFPVPIEPWPEARPPAATGSQPMPAPMPVYLFIFDEWSYVRSFEANRPRGEFPNLRALAEESIVCHDAHAPGPRTDMSIPRILLASTARPEVHDGVAGLSAPGGFVPAAEAATIFEPLGRQGWRTVMLGFSLPYRFWLTDSVEVCRPRCYYPRPETVGSSVGWHLLNASHYIPHAWWQHRYKSGEERVLRKMCIQLLTEIREDAERVIRDEPQPMAVIHYPLPHPPAVLNADLTFRPVGEVGWAPRWLGQYQSNLAAHDTMIGMLVQRLREAGRYEQCLLVVTSDHSWRDDPALKGQTGDVLTHVPLLIKLPGRQRPRQVSERVELWRLGRFIASVAEDRPSDESAAQVALLRPDSVDSTPATTPR